ncbi:hypothetical protein N7447_000170 [Penicillium robsamsonii]|uniref:uncharacterized protein n=1 Tax=Penicillium robsamsonii TaxID=1792511 RepID=UPI002546DF0E|nr:uncharacterized protein N7447_000170 [Penicillium robsamsonii]KAJ5834144.1 hypothetical protein N7447_000170 [Penicillium robsamsonii]
MEKDRVQEGSAESDETTSNEFNLLLHEITARCNQQAREINKWLFYTKNFKQTIADTLEKEKLKKQGADIKAMRWQPRTPRTPRILRTPRAFQIPN